VCFIFISFETFHHWGFEPAERTDSVNDQATDGHQLGQTFKQMKSFSHFVLQQENEGNSWGYINAEYWFLKRKKKSWRNKKTWEIQFVGFKLIVFCIYWYLLVLRQVVLRYHGPNGPQFVPFATTSDVFKTKSCLFSLLPQPMNVKVYHLNNYHVLCPRSGSKVVLVHGACWTPPGLPLVTGPVCGFHGQDLEV